MANHADLTGAELHENKGVASANDGEVATADTGATVWKKIGIDNVDATDILGLNTYVLTTSLDDISTASSTYLVVPYAGSATGIFTVIDGAIATADSVLTFRNHSGGSMGTITVANSGSAAGDIDSLSPNTNNTFTAGERIKIETDGASSNTVKVNITLLFTRTA